MTKAYIGGVFSPKFFKSKGSWQKSRVIIRIKQNWVMVRVCSRDMEDGIFRVEVDPTKRS
jgi:hypothetical protein